MVRCAPVSRSTLLSNFLDQPTGLVENLRTMIIGPDYAARRHDPETSSGLLGAYDPDAGLTDAWPGLLAGETVDLLTPRVFIQQALVRYFLEEELAPGLANGVQSGSLPNAIIHDSGATIWAGSSRTPNVLTDVVVGDHVYLTTDDAGSNAFETTVQDLLFTGGDPTILVLSDNLPPALTGGTNFNINIDEVVASQELESADFTASATQLAVDPGVAVTTTRTGTSTPVYGGEAPYSRVYTDYRALRQANIESVVSVTNEDQLDTLFIGWQYPESELGFAMARALAPQPVPASPNLPAVLGAPITTDDSAGWAAVVSHVGARSDWYTIAPLTDDAGIQATVRSMVAGRDAQGLPSRVFLSFDLTYSTNLFSGSHAVTVSDPTDTTLTATDPIFAGAVRGDTVTTDVGTRTIDLVTSNQEVVVTVAATGATTVTSIDHPLSTVEQSLDYGTRVQAVADKTVSVIFPPDPTWDGTVVQGYLYAAASAGLRGYTAPHQPLTGALMDARWAVPQSAYEFLGQLETQTIFGAHVSQSCSGQASVLAARTADQSSILTRTESIVANADAITRYLNDVIAGFAGRTRVTVSSLSQLRGVVSTALEFLKSETAIDGFGSVMVEGTAGQPVQSAADQSQVDLPITLTLSSVLETVVLDTTVTLDVI